MMRKSAASPLVITDPVITKKKSILASTLHNIGKNIQYWRRYQYWYHRQYQWIRYPHVVVIPDPVIKVSSLSCPILMKIWHQTIHTAEN